MLLIISWKPKQKDMEVKIMNIVFVVTDESKSCYDAGGVFVGVFSTYDQAKAYIDRLGGKIGRDYDITEEIIDSL